MLLQISSIVLKCSTNAFGSFKRFIPASSRLLIKNLYFGSCKSYQQINIVKKLSLSHSFIKLSNVLVFHDPEPPIINTLYGGSGINGHILLWFLLFSFVISSKLIIFVCYENDVWMIKDKYEFFGMKKKQKDCFKYFRFIRFWLKNQKLKVYKT